MPKPWSEVGVPLHEELIRGIESLNFPTMTPIQACTIPRLINKKDTVAEAVTGSGKTLAFLIPILEILKRREAEEKWKKHQIGAIIISPTRELALQTKQVLEQLLNFTTGLTHLSFIGGTSIEQDLHRFASGGGNIIICTPGRFEDLLSRKAEINLGASLKTLEILILDEADRLLDYGFRSSIDTILSYLPKQRRTGLFSATQTKQLQDLIRAGLRNPVVISVSSKNEQSTPELLDNYYVLVNNNNKLGALLSFLEVRNVRRLLLFLPTCACVDYWAQILPHFVAIPVLAIHGKMKDRRNKILDRFKESPEALLLCTDVMARGIDIPEVDWVLQWDPPTSASAFVHRIGRTARQGRQGSSLVFLLENEETYVDFIEKNQRVKLQRLSDASDTNQGVSLRKTLQELQLKDRGLMEKATRAFVSYIRAYSKHECSLLLQVKELPLGAVASAYGLLRLPKMPELKGVTVEGFQGVEGVDLDEIPYRDKQKEVVRLRHRQIYKETGSWPGKIKKGPRKSTEAWSLTKERKINRKEKRLKRKQAKQNEQGKGKKRKKEGMSDEDLQELVRDVALMKKFKRKKIGEEQFDKEFGIL